MRFFSEAETWAVNREWNDAYRSRLDALRVQITQENAMKRALEEKEHERAEKEHAQRELELLRGRLRARGIDPAG